MTLQPGANVLNMLCWVSWFIYYYAECRYAECRFVEWCIFIGAICNLCQYLHTVFYQV